MGALCYRLGMDNCDCTPENCPCEDAHLATLFKKHMNRTGFFTWYTVDTEKRTVKAIKEVVIRGKVIFKMPWVNRRSELQKMLFD